ASRLIWLATSMSAFWLGLVVAEHVPAAVRSKLIPARLSGTSTDPLIEQLNAMEARLAAIESQQRTAPTQMANRILRELSDRPTMTSPASTDFDRSGDESRLA